ncbi:MAG: dTDP-4-dehydrorhamnose 3,5-epimerase [Alphaproteobacteria bacterium]
MRFASTSIPGAWIVELEPHADARGSFARTFCQREFAAHGLATDFPQHSRSFNKAKGTLRGVHFQKPPYAEAKLVSCVRGSIYDVCVDLRPDSPTFRSWLAVELTESNGKQFYIPEGCAHGFQTLADNSEVNYLISTFYEPTAGAGWRYDDPAFGVAWPLPVAAINDKDLAWPAFEA